MKNKINEVKVGFTVFSAFLIIVILMVWVNNITFSDDNFILNVQFDNVSGLYKKDKVTVNGLEKGFVDDLILNSNGVTARLILKNDVDLRSDAKFSIVMLDLMGGKKIEIIPGVSSEKIDINIIQKGNFAGDFATTMAILTSVQDDLLLTIKQTKEITTSLNSFMKDENVLGELKQTLVKTNKTIDVFSAILSENRTEINKFVENGTILTDSLNQFWGRNQANFTDFVSQTKSTLRETENLISNLSGIINETKKQENNLGKVIYDESYIKKIDSTLQKLEKLTNLLIEQLQSEGINVKTNIF